MKILYIKNNSERTKEFQLKTIVYEENGQKYVKKQAIHDASIPHLKRMKENYNRLASSIVDPRIKLAKIIDETENSLTFEFINGVSLEKKYNAAKKLNNHTDNEVISAYIEVLKTGFKTCTFDSKTMVTDTYKTLFSNLDFSDLDGEACFEGISNIDLIFSNIIYKDESIYLIDYEWIYDINLPVKYILYRPLHMMQQEGETLLETYDVNAPIYAKMERNFVDTYVMKNSFYFQRDNYMHKRVNLIEHVHKQEAHIVNQKLVMLTKDSIIRDKNRHIKNLSKTHEKIIYDKDVHIQNQENRINELQQHLQDAAELLESMRLKNRFKRLLKKIIPSPLWHLLKKMKHKIRPQAIHIEPISNYPLNNYSYLKPRLTKSIENEINQLNHKPLISIIMPVYNVAPKWLALAIESIESQWYTNWELCMVDDKSTDEETLTYLRNIDNPKIKVKFLEENLNISGASNAALELTSGEYIALMDNDDELTPDALYEVVKAINNGAEFIYSDEDKLEMDGSYSDPHFKPDFAPDMFLSQNYLSHLGVIKKDLITKVSGFTIGLEGSQDFDLYLKVLEHTDKIHHITKVLYHWRKIPGSTASEYGEKSYAQEAGRKALQNAMQRRNLSATVKNGQTLGTYKVDYILTSTPLVSIIIPFKDKPELLKTCVESILEKSTYQNFEIIGISNNSTEDEIFKEMDRLQSLDKRIEFHEYNVLFNYSKINNYAVNTYAKGEQILFLNNDIEIITPRWIEELLMYSQDENNGAIGAKLYFPNDTIQHAGIVLAPKTIHSTILMYQGYPRDHYGYISRLRCVNNYSAVTAACLMIKRTLFDKIGSFDEEKQSIAYNDIDLCLRLQDAGYKNVWTPYCEAYHHESISRGYETSVEDVERREKEKWHLKEKYPDIFTKGDPCYNTNLTRFGVGSELSTAVTKDHTLVEGKAFYETLIISQNIRERQHDTLAIFSHFDAENEIKEDVLYYLKSLSNFTDILFVSTAENLSEETIKVIEPYCKDIIVKKNIGYDFGAWKTGLDYIGDDINHYESLILCNDSVYGPLFDLEDIFKKMKTYDLWSMTDNYEIEYHLQSYFMVYNKSAYSHDIFKMFWENFKIYEDKQTLIEHNEIGFSQNMINSGLTYNSYYSVQNKNYVNVLQYHWDTLIQEYQFPFIKKELLKRNPLQLPIDNWTDIVQSVSDYDTALIQNQLN
ncbi:MAG: glycosyltransferase [Epsilonproteobacteria bacterium]|nr:glycosyltransferase [Campylobacterota bacterium]